MLPTFVNVGAVSLNVPLLAVLYLIVAPLVGVVTVTLAQLCAVPLLVVVPLYVNVLFDALAITFGVQT